ncbi:MAG: hypothetical protein HYV02_08090 [Deltaproteobacteria bacterium]|nr:hypothetical protein [Deltaproteobacteria bacterium]
MTAHEREGIIDTQSQQAWWALAFQQRATTQGLEILRQRLGQKIIRIFQPMRLLLEYHRGAFQLRRRPLYPGYAFIQCAPTVLRHVIDNRPDSMYGPVRLGESLIPVQSHEMDLLQALTGNTGTAGLSHGELQGDRVHIISGPLQGKEGMILKFSKRKHRATICVSLDNKRIRLDLACITRPRITHDH